MKSIFVLSLIAIIGGNARGAEPTLAEIDAMREYVASQRKPKRGEKFSREQVQARRSKNWIPTIEAAEPHDGEFGRLDVQVLKKISDDKFEERVLVKAGRKTLEGATITPSIYESRYYTLHGVPGPIGREIEMNEFVFRVVRGVPEVVPPEIVKKVLK